MIFRPRKAIKFFGLKIHGLIPRRQSELAASIGQTVEAELVSHKDIQDALRKPEVEKDVTALIDKQIDIFLHQKLASNPMIAMFLQGELLISIKAMLVEQLVNSIPDFFDVMLSRVEKDLDFRQMVQEKIESFDLEKLEQLIYNISAKELKAIEVLGGVLGFVVGLVQLAVLTLIS